MVMALAPAPRQRLSEVISDGVKYFMEKLLVQIYEHFDEQELTDVTFKLTNPTALVTAHRLILSSASPYFRQLFKSDEGICSLIELDDIDSDTFERLIAFCYTGQVLITLDNVERILKASLKLQLKDAIAECVDFLINHINDYTLERLYLLENETQIDMLRQKILEYELENFTEVAQSAEFLNFEANKLQAHLESDDLNIENETDAFTAVKRWYEHNPKARKQQLPDLVSCLRLNQFDTNFLLKQIHPLPGCENIAFKMISWVNVPLTRSTIILNFPNRRTAQKQFLALNTAYEHRGTIFQYHKTEGSWLKWFDIQIDVDVLRVVPLGDNLIFVGGKRNDEPINEVKSWSFKTKTFKQMASMNESRWAHCVALLNDEIYAIGGMGTSGEALRSVEKYTEPNGWMSVSDMITPRYFVGAVTLNGSIYVVSGTTGNEYLKSVECYDPTTNCWSQCSNLNEARCNTGVTVHNGYIFAVGGCANRKLQTIERYDAHKCEWTKIGSLNTSIEHPGTISIGNQLWAVSGFKNDCVSVYDDETDKWIEKTPIPVRGGYYCFSVPKAILESEKQL